MGNAAGHGWAGGQGAPSAAAAGTRRGRGGGAHAASCHWAHARAAIFRRPHSQFLTSTTASSAGRSNNLPVVFHLRSSPPWMLSDFVSGAL